MIFFSCSKPNGDDDYFKGTMQARINGELIIFDEAYGDRRLGWDGIWSGINNIVGITDRKVSGYEIQIVFPLNQMKGVLYHPSCMYRPWIGDYYNYNQTAYITKAINSANAEFSGTLTFSSVENNRYKGTFSFTGFISDPILKDSIVVTEGKFEIDSDGKKW